MKNHEKQQKNTENRVQKTKKMNVQHFKKITRAIEFVADRHTELIALYIYRISKIIYIKYLGIPHYGIVYR